MNTKLFKSLIAAVGIAFTLAFCLVVVPELVNKPNVTAAFAAGFVNPFAAGYSIDTIACWCALAIWVIYEASTKGIRHGWVAVVIGIVPGVAAGLCMYLLIRLKQETALSEPSTRLPQSNGDAAG